MKRKISVKFTDTSSSISTDVDLDEYCPHCGRPGAHILYNTMASKLYNSVENSVALFLKCSISECNKFHIQEFPFGKHSPGGDNLKFVGNKINYTYRVKLDNTLPEIVNQTFPAFKNIFEQSLEAEVQGLDQIAGVGYRKSIEFLIKEYAIHKDPESAENIKAKFLGKVIDENLIEFPKIQTLSKAAVWIGNDETHFVRVHEDKDIHDMKEFLIATALFISAELKVDEAINFTSRPK